MTVITSRSCLKCGNQPLINVRYEDAKGKPAGGHTVCLDCGPLSATHLPMTAAAQSPVTSSKPFDLENGAAA